MGRTLHFEIKKDKNFTKKEIEAIQEVSEYYNSGPFENIWSCENFYADPLRIMPNPQLKLNNAIPDVFQLVEDWFNYLIQTEGYSPIKAKKRLINEGLAIEWNENFEKECNGFVKTQGNELNSLLVLQALIDISKRVEKAEIYLRDEGEFLLCPLYIQKGKCFPDLEDMKERVNEFASKIALTNSYYISKIPWAQGLSEDMQKDFGIEYGDGGNEDFLMKLINDVLRNVREVEKRIKNNMNFSLPMFCIFNLKNKKESSIQNWFDPYLFTREVDINRFLDYKMSPATLMDGFNGEGFGLTDNDAEQSSYQMIAQIQNLLGGKDVNMNILGEE